MQEMFVAAVLATGHARFCAEIHVRQEMREVTTHGLRHVPLVLEGLAAGRMTPRPNRKLLHEDGATLILDGDNGPGALGCMDALELSAFIRKYDDVSWLPFRAHSG